MPGGYFSTASSSACSPRARANWANHSYCVPMCFLARSDVYQPAISGSASASAQFAYTTGAMRADRHRAFASLRMRSMARSS